MNSVYKITAKIHFPEGVAPGAGSTSNRQVVARNGKDEVVLRGTALAGALRNSYSALAGNDKAEHWFGAALDELREADSFIKVADAIIDCKALNERTHNMVNRHTGAVAKGALFSLEAVPPGSSTTLSVTLKKGAGTQEDYKEFVDIFTQIIGSELSIGGNANRGIGRMQVEGNMYLRMFDLDNVAGTAAWMDAEYEERRQGVQLKGDTIVISPYTEKLVINLELGIPRGEDMLIGDGQETDYALQPQKIIFADGSEHWRIPGSSLRGILKSWMTRLAVRDGENIYDSLTHWKKTAPSDYKPDDAGWGFIEKEQREKYQTNPYLLNDPVLDLFGSMYKKGRIHITDSFSSSTIKDSDIQERMHVAIDRFSGGTNEGALFNNQVLVNDTLRFHLTISVSTPTETEVHWLTKALRAVHLGILLVGSSKSGGRLEIKTISATGTCSDIIRPLSKEII